MQNSVDNPTLPSLSAGASCGVLTNAKGQIVLLHTDDLSSIQWVEYEPATRAFILVHEDGKIQDLGLKLGDKMNTNIANGTEVVLVKIADNAIVSTQKTSILIKDY